MDRLLNPARILIKANELATLYISIETNGLHPLISGKAQNGTASLLTPNKLDNDQNALHRDKSLRLQFYSLTVLLH